MGAWGGGESGWVVGRGRAVGRIPKMEWITGKPENKMKCEK